MEYESKVRPQAIIINQAKKMRVVCGGYKKKKFDLAWLREHLKCHEA